MIRKMLNNIQLIITIFQKEFKIKTNKHIWNMADDFEYQIDASVKKNNKYINK